ncbi:MAG: hypothetical protein COB93_01615 [Sneathiella sp.]|nr:MAG: hypothetical protein COB93_01615 [Sneathiella sp.]
MIFGKILMAASLSLVVAINAPHASPLSAEGGTEITKATLVGINQAVPALTDGRPTSATKVALFGEKIQTGAADHVSAAAAKDESFFHPALLLFMFALGAIIWLGRRRHKDHLIED